MFFFETNDALTIFEAFLFLMFLQIIGVLKFLNHIFLIIKVELIH